MRSSGVVILFFIATITATSFSGQTLAGSAGTESILIPPTIAEPSEAFTCWGAPDSPAIAIHDDGLESEYLVDDQQVSTQLLNGISFESIAESPDATSVWQSWLKPVVLCDAYNAMGDQCGRLNHKVFKQFGACWTGRADVLLLWRNAPQPYLLANQTAGTGYATFGADQLESTLAAGPRFQLFRTDSCGRTWEWAYLRGFNFRSQRVLPSLGTNSYSTGSLYGNSAQPFDEAFANLGSGVQTFEMNYRFATNRAWRWLAGFRWLEWREAFSMTTNEFGTNTSDLYQNNVFNSLYGGQIGADVLLLTLPWLKVDSVVKAGAYYNNAVQRSLYQTTSGGTTQTLTTAVGQDPASCGFVGELGLNAALPLTSRIDFRFGYEALWIATIAQPTNQLAGQNLQIGQPPAGTLDTGGSVVVQGISLGLEGRW